MIKQKDNLSSNNSPKIDEKNEMPKLKNWEKWVCWVFASLGIVGFIVALVQFWSQQLPIEILNRQTSWAYIGLGFTLAGLMVYGYFRHRYVSFNSRIEDYSEILAWIVEAETAEERLTTPEQRPKNFSKKFDDMQQEVRRLRDIGKEMWTEFQVLPLNQMLIEFMKVDDLKTEAQSTLDQVREYAEDSGYRYDREYFGRWSERVANAMEKIEAAENDTERNEKDVVKRNVRRDDSAEELRAVLKTMYEHVADYEKNWTEGSAIVRALILLMATAIPIVLVMGLVPVLHPSGNGMLGVLNWGLLGVSGALTSAMLALRNSDLIEVGNTEGKKELWRTVLGAALGFVAGALTFGIISGGLLSGVAVPTVVSNNCCNTGLSPSDLGLSVVWGVASGLLFEKVFERVRGITEN